MAGTWREEKAKYKERTAGGVYFWSAPTLWGEDIQKRLYDKLPKKMKLAVVALESHKTPDGNHATIYYVNQDGVIQYFDEYGLNDFWYGVRQAGDAGNMNEWAYDGKYSEGLQLQRKRK